MFKFGANGREEIHFKIEGARENWKRIDIFIFNGVEVRKSGIVDSIWSPAYTSP